MIELKAALKISNIEKVLLFDDGICQRIIYVFKDGTASHVPFSTGLLAATTEIDCPIISVEGFIHGA